MRIERLCFATGNSHKLGEVREILTSLGVTEPVFGLGDVGAGDVEVEETGATFAANALLKAEGFGRAAGLPTLADDSGLVVDCLGGRPGVRSARYADTNEARIARVVDETRAALATDSSLLPTARFVCAMAFWFPPDWGRAPLAAEGTVEGEIVLEQRGAGGFGYDPIFYVPDLGATLAEIAPEAKNAISHRGRALAAMVARLRDLGLLASATS